MWCKDLLELAYMVAILMQPQVPQRSWRRTHTAWWCWGFTTTFGSQQCTQLVSHHLLWVIVGPAVSLVRFFSFRPARNWNPNMPRKDVLYWWMWSYSALMCIWKEGSRMFVSWYTLFVKHVTPIWLPIITSPTPHHVWVMFNESFRENPGN